MKQILTMLLVLCYAGLLYAVPPVSALKDKQLAGLLQTLQEADGYSYRILITSVMNNDPAQKEQTEMNNYQSKDQFIIYSGSADNIVMVCRNGQFRVNHRDRTIFYRQYDTDSMSRQAEQEMMQTKNALSLDSVFLAGASIADKKEDKVKLSYRLKYEASSMIKSMEIVCRKQGFFDRIAYTVERPVAGTDKLLKSGPVMIRQQVVMSGYERKIPAEVSALLPEMKNIKGYLARTYKGYTITSL